jgi:hypothetical protein
VFQGIIPADGPEPGGNTIGAVPVDPPTGSQGLSCALTNGNGEAAIEVVGSDPGVDVVAWFVDENIFRDVTTTLGDPTPVVSTAPTVIPVDPVVLNTGRAGSAGGSSSSSSSSNAGGGSITTTVIGNNSSPVGKANSCKVNSMRLYAKKGYVALKVSCTQSKSDAVVIRTYRKNGRLLHSYRKTIAAGKTVRIRLSTRRVAHVTVSA